MNDEDGEKIFNVMGAKSIDEVNQWNEIGTAREYSTGYIGIYMVTLPTNTNIYLLLEDKKVKLSHIGKNTLLN